MAATTHSTDKVIEGFGFLDVFRTGRMAEVPADLCSGFNRSQVVYGIRRTCTHFLAVFLLLVSLVTPCSSELITPHSVDDSSGAVWVINPFNLAQNGANVCATTSLKLATTFLSADELKGECDSLYPRATCRILRDGDISVSDLYVKVYNYTCCDGFQRQGNSCPNVCPRLTYGPNCSLNCACMNGGSCDPANGTCFCRPGWTGRYCQHTCPSDRYGQGCSEACACQNDGSCHPETGACLCPIDFEGDRCEIDCSVSMSDARCLARDAFCDKCEKGVCDTSLGSCRCEDGWQGRFCSHTCDGSFYGNFCNNPCACPNGGSCLPADGTCRCLPGWTGPRCDRQCPAGFFGDGCGRRCDCPDGNECDHVNGSCICPNGWTGQFCTTPCENGHWGRNCAQECDCQDRENCEPITGHCYIPEGGTFDSTTPASGSGRSTLGSGEIAAIAASAGVLVLVVVAVIVVFARKHQQKGTRDPHQTPLQANGAAGVHVNGPQANGTLRYQADPSVNSIAPPTLPRSPATFSRNFPDPSLNTGYETIRTNQDSAQSPYLEIYDDLRGQVDNPLYGDTGGYEVPTPRASMDRSEVPVGPSGYADLNHAERDATNDYTHLQSQTALR